MANENVPKTFHVFLTKRPGTCNEPSVEDFGYEEVPYPGGALAHGELLIKNVYLSMDPALRCLMNESTGVDYVEPWKLNKTIIGLGGVGKVIASRCANIKSGDLVLGTFFWPWKSYFTMSAEDVRVVPEIVLQLSLTLCISAFGGTGLTAYFGVKEKGHIQKGASQTMVISAAAGSTGSLAGQIAKTEGCARVVGLCGTEEKCKWLTEELGFDAAINYKTESVASRLCETCPQGIDIYFDNVGGNISDEVIKKMNQDSHIILCGQIAVYNTDLLYPPPLSSEMATLVKEKNITRDRYLVLNYKDRFEEGIQKLLEMYMNGTLKVKETIEKGLSNASRAFISMMKGGNIGKQIVQVAE